jgi:cytochrome c oxidase subunit 2
MNRTVYVYEQEEFERVIAEKANWLGDTAITPQEKGERLYQQACASCHLPTDDKKIGPGFQIVSEAIRDQTEIQFENAPPLVPDENYLRESILVPAAKIREGYPNQMNSFQGQLDDKRINYLITYIKSIASPEIGAEFETPEELDPAAESTEQSE